MSTLDPSNKIQQVCKNFHLTEAQLVKIMSLFLVDILKGLGRKTHANACVKCFVTYVTDMPSGNEDGKYLALDLGGTNFRVLLITFTKRQFEMKSKIYEVPQSKLTGTGDNLFDHVACCLADFCNVHKIKERLALGFTFSFPVSQQGLTVGILERWTKGFNCSNSEGKDVGQMLQEAVARRNDIDISVVALLNDTTGTLMSCAWWNQDCKIGLIVGTGSNACYLERTANAENYLGDMRKSHVIINTECGAFGDRGQLDFVRTEFDRDVDAMSVRPGAQINEKMISGMYLGEIARVIMVRCCKGGLLFGGNCSDELKVPSSFLTKHISAIESDPEGVYDNCRQILDELGLRHASQQDLVDVRYICECVSRRAAHLTAATIATLVNKMGYVRTVIGVDGSVFRLHPTFSRLLSDKVNELVRPGLRIKLVLSEDGSGRGAALVAAACDTATKNAKLSLTGSIKSNK